VRHFQPTLPERTLPERVLPAPTLPERALPEAALPEAALPAPTLPEPTTRAGRSGPLRQELLEFLLGGGLTFVLLPGFWLLRLLLGADDAEWNIGFLAFYAAYLINDPHFSVTYLLFYRRVRERLLSPEISAAQRLRYLWAGFCVPALLAAWLGLGLARSSAESLGLLFQVMFFLVSWHYVKQAFGVLLVLSARRGVRYSPLERRLFLFHCLSAWLYARATPFDPGSAQIEQGVFYHSLPHPSWLMTATLVPFALGALGLAWALVSFYRRQRAFAPLVPLSSFLVSTWLWVVYASVDPLLFYVIPALHSLQYLYFVYLERAAAARRAEGPPVFGRPLGTALGLLALSATALGFLLFHGLPGVLDDLFVTGAGPDSALGPTPYLAAFVAFVNVHHYFMDSVIWRREVPEARELFRAPAGFRAG